MTPETAERLKRLLTSLRGPKYSESAALNDAIVCEEILELLAEEALERYHEERGRDGA